ncbi:hypothetical protein KAI87_01755 [Myxococcota bacterium]|nr:hypothetical protein [Myxococcota bacterium]
MQKILILSIVVLKGISGFWGCAGVDPNLKITLDKWRGDIVHVEDVFAGVGPERPALKTGQWATYLVRNKKKKLSEYDSDLSLISYRITGEENNALWIEVEHLTYSERFFYMILIQKGAWDSVDSLGIKRLIMQKEGEQAKEYPPSLREKLARPVFSWLLAYSYSGEVLDAPEASEPAGKEEALPQAQRVKVPAGVFEGFAQISITTPSILGKEKSKVWVHGAIPVTGMLKAEALDGDLVMELVEYGFTGAKMAISGEVEMVDGD